MESMKYLHRIALTALVIGICAGLGSFVGVLVSMHSIFPSAVAGKDARYTSFDQSCNVLKINIHGTIVSTDSGGMSTAVATNTYAETGFAIASDITSAVRSAAMDENIKGLLIDVDSGGGGAEAGAEIAHAVQKFGKPSVAIIHEVGASSGYLIASAADTVVASEDSTVGSIGSTSSFLNYSAKDLKEGITYVQLSSGPYKDIFSPDKPMTTAERALIMRDITISRDNFVDLVARNRHQSTSSISELADGSAMLGAAALAHGLIDIIGYSDDAEKVLESKIGEPVNICAGN